MTLTQTRRFERHPERRTERVAIGSDRIGWLRDPNNQPLPQAQSQRTAQELIAIEHRLAEAQTRYVAARRDWLDIARRKDEPWTDAVRAAPAKAELQAAEAIRNSAIAKIDELRRLLHAQRRAELMGMPVPTAPIESNAAGHAARSGGSASGSWLDRILGRAG